MPASHRNLFPIGAPMLVATLFAACQSGSPRPPALQIEAPAAAATTPVQMAGLHNVVTYAPDLVCGGVPEGREGLETLAAMGIKTVVSVDGATPDIATAEQLGMRYVHLPISYDTVTGARQKELAQAIASCDGPIYMHCHHGKHRSAAALASAVVLAGVLTPEQAEARMRVSGTAKDYTGLWAAVRAAKPLPPDALRVDPASLPKIAVVTGMVATMAEIDAVIDLVKQAKEAGWQAPSDHPDLVATKETKRLHALFANLKDDPESAKMPAAYQRLLQQAIDATHALDEAVRGSDTTGAATHLAAINKSCKECHVVYRDK